jgi:hypothetical protein
MIFLGMLSPLAKGPHYRFRSKRNLAQSPATLASFSISLQASRRSYGNYFRSASCHDAKVCGCEEEGSKKPARGAEATSPLMGRALLSCIFYAILNDAASRPLMCWPRCHFAWHHSFESNEVRHDK